MKKEVAVKEKPGQWGELIAGQVAAISDLAISKALEQSRESFTAFVMDIQQQANALYAGHPTLHVKINEMPSTPLKLRASKKLPRLVVNAKLGLYTLLVGPAGCGKTTMANQVAESLGVSFGAVCLTAGASETWLFGRQTPNGFVEGPFSKAYREGGVFLADEMDAADANLLLSINTALSHDEMLNPMSGETIKKHKDFVFIGAANTNGKGSTHTYTGRSRLDAATLDRMIIVEVGYDEHLENDLCTDSKMRQFLRELRSALTKEGYDEFVSTRAFISSQRQLHAGVDREDIMESLIANWGDGARDTAKRIYNQVWAKRSHTESLVQREKFYSKFVEKEGMQKWRPIEWNPDL